MKVKSSNKFSLSQILALIGTLFVTFSWMTGGLESTAYLFYSIIVLILLILLFRYKQKNIVKFNILSLLLMAFVFISVISYIWSVNRFDTVVGIMLLVIAGMLYEITIKFLRADNLYSLWKTIFIIGSVVAVLWGIPIYLANRFDGRFITPVYWPNITAVLLVPPYLLSLNELYSSKDIKRYISYAISASLCGMGFILTFSRASYIVFGILIFLIIVLSLKNTKFYKAFFLTATASLLLAASLYGIRSMIVKNSININFTSNDKKSTEITNNSVTDRKSYWLSTVNIIKDNPFLGTGYNTFASIYPKYQRSASAETNNPHNYLLKITSEVGILGGVIFIAIIIYISFKAFRQRQDLELLIISASALMILIHSILDTDLAFPVALFTLSILLGFIAIRLDDSFKTNHLNFLFNTKNNLAIWALIIATTITTSMVSYFYFQVKLFQDQLIFYEINKPQDRLDIIRGANSGFIKDPNNLSTEAEILLNLAIELPNKIDANNVRSSKEKVAIAMNSDKYDAKNYYLAARISELENDKERAKQNYKKSIELDSYNNLNTYIYYVKFLYNISEKNDAIKECNYIINQYDNFVLYSKASIRPYYLQQLSMLLNLRASILIENRQFDLAQVDLERSYDLFHEDTSKALLQKIKNIQSQQ